MYGVSGASWLCLGDRPTLVVLGPRSSPLLPTCRQYLKTGEAKAVGFLRN